MAELPRLPSGTVTFLFTDIEGSTRLWGVHPEMMPAAYARHDAILREAVSAQRGVVYKAIGDAFQVAFPTAPEAIAAALTIQAALQTEGWPTPEPLKVRMALHTGAVDPDPDGDYRSPVLNRLGRLLGAAHGGQTLTSEIVAGLTRDSLPADATLRDLGSHQLKDLLEPEHVYQLLHPALPRDFPPLATLSARPHNLPRQPTPFLGREGEVAQVTTLLRRDEVQLLTLTGPGGTGKTRLALQAAAELVEDFPDGAWFVPLAPLADPALVPNTIATVLGVREEGSRPLSTALAHHLQDKRLLLVLDNLEHLLPATAPGIGDLLATAPGVTILATSRLPLRLRAERELPISPLALPRRKPPPTFEQLGQYDAVRLFIERAQAVKPDFAVTNDNAPAVAEICHRLDGLPLAIELAATRIRLLPPQAMLRRLEGRLAFLTGGARDVPARQQTLREAIAWSYDLLTPDEQALFRRLSVFAGGWTLEAAEAVAGTPGSGELGLAVLDGLERLAEHSLLRPEDGPDGEPRFFMLETIREYGEEQLAIRSEVDEARERHATYFLALAEEGEPALQLGLAEGGWLDRVEREHDNLRAALEWTLTHTSDSALRMAGTLVWFWWQRGYLSEGQGWLERALGAAPLAAAPLRAKALDGIGMMASTLVHLDVAAERHEQALALAKAYGDPADIARALQSGAYVSHLRGDDVRAAARFEDALEHVRASNDWKWISIVLHNFAGFLWERGDHDRADPLLEESLAIARTFGPSSLLANGLSLRGEVLITRGDLATAVPVCREALTLGRDLGFKHCVAGTLETLGRLAGLVGDPERAAHLWGAAEEINRTMGVPSVLQDYPSYEDAIATVREALGEVAFDAAWEAGRALSLEEAVAEALAVEVPANG